MSCGEVPRNRQIVPLKSIGDNAVGAIGESCILISISELSNHQTLDFTENATHSKVLNHTVNMVETLTHIFNKQNLALIVKVKRSASQGVEYAKVAAGESAFGGDAVMR